MIPEIFEYLAREPEEGGVARAPLGAKLPARHEPDPALKRRRRRGAVDLGVPELEGISESAA
jgi:hypothetical protein